MTDKPSGEPLPNHYRLMYPSNYIAASDLDGKDRTVTIESIELMELKDERGDSHIKPVIRFKGAKKAFVCNKTNARTIASHHGKVPAKWVGKQITLFATPITAFGKTDDAIRIRPPN